MDYQAHNSVSGYYFECIRYTDFEWSPHLHRHPELIHVRDGAVCVSINGREERIEAGEFAWIPSNRVHAYHTPDHSLVDVCIVSENHIPFFTRAIGGKAPDRLRFTCSAATTAFARSVFFVTDRIPDLYERKAALYAMLGEFEKQVTFSDIDNRDETLLEQIVRYVEKNYTAPITLKEMAKELGYAPGYLSRYFHNRIAMNFTHYVNQYRVSAAESLLRNTDMTITEVAVQSGFQSIRNFNRIYREHTGRTPKEFVRDGAPTGQRKECDQ